MTTAGEARQRLDSSTPEATEVATVDLFHSQGRRPRVRKQKNPALAGSDMRGRGVYRALVRARWDAVVAAGTRR